MDLQKMASEFAAAVMQVLQEATIDELTGTTGAFLGRTKPQTAGALRRGYARVASVATVSALGTTLKMRALKKDMKGLKMKGMKPIKLDATLKKKTKAVKTPAKKAPIKKAVKRSHKKKVSR